MVFRKKHICSTLGVFAMLSCSSTLVYSQTLNISVKATLPSILTESSGIEVINRNSIWSHNDSRGVAELYNFDSTGTLLRTLKIINVANIDWEDMAADAAGNLYIGDIGNNANIRQDLKIYILPDPSTIVVDSIEPQVISYSYPDQFAFPPPDSLKNFDAEALIFYNDSLYIFSKDWSDPYSGYTKLYQLPSVPGTYVAQLIDSFYTGPGPTIPYSVTSADISSDNSRLMLLGYNKCWLFTDFTGNDFFSGTNQLFDLPSLSQKEAIGFITNDELYVTDELAFGIGQKLYYLHILPINSSINTPENNNIEFTFFPNPFSDNSAISIRVKEQGEYNLLIYNELGDYIYSETLIFYPDKAQHIFLNETVFKNNSGVFIIELRTENNQIYRKRIVRY